LILLVCFSVIFLFIGTKFFTIDEIEITPMNIIEEESLANCIDRNIFLVPLYSLREAIEEIPEVKSATLKKELPHKLTVEIHKYEPCALLNKDRELAVSKEGVVFPCKGVIEISSPPAPDTEGRAGYPLVIYEGENLPLGKPWPGLEEAIKTYLSAKDILPIGVIKVERNREVFLYTQNTKTEIRMGSEKYEENLERLKILMEMLPSKDVEYVDFRFGEDIIVKQ
jgi:hypothetical protein